MSWVHVECVDEYFSGTIARFVPTGELVYVYGTDVCWDEENDREGRYINYRTANGEDTYDITDMSYDEVVTEVLNPWLPPSQYYVGKDGKPGFIELVKPSHYKRSFDTVRYSLSCNIKDVLKANIGKSYWYPHAVEKMMVEHSMQVLSPDFAICPGPSSTIVLYYKGMSVGHVNDNMALRVHPKYRAHFHPLIHKIPGVIYEDK